MSAGDLTPEEWAHVKDVLRRRGGIAAALLQCDDHVRAEAGAQIRELREALGVVEARVSDLGAQVARLTRPRRA